MSKLMLIDAVHPEETRVALVSNGSVHDFDFEAAGKRQLRGNIYLAKVTRVEPSLQAAFVEYGGNRQGFLAFSEIHPDYYQLPQEDREALLREEAELAAAEAEDDEVDDPSDVEIDDEIEVPDDITDEAEPDEHADDDDNENAAETDPTTDDADEPEEDAASDDAEEQADAEATNGKARKSKSKAEPRRRRRRTHPSRRYKIQEVIRRRQVMLIQVVKEERGNKGAALTTYLSLAGRYCVLMPNTPRGGGISRKISNSSDRKRLKAITSDLAVPQGMGLIVRTAGAKRTKNDIKRDFNYLQNLWDTIREKTLTSMAPSMINEEGGLVHRAMRDLYDKDIGEVLVQGEDAYREAKDLARLLMPSQASKVKQWKSVSPLFVAKRVEEQLDSIFSPIVKLKSGGYLVINQTEALVAIDVNSGKSTRGRNIEQTATQTNTEAAEEACRQMRLRDLAGLIVIDFIDMDENKNNRSVEKKMRDALSLDRARVQNGRISQFGLMEISRQRRRTGVYESSSTPCESCNGNGRQRSIESAALQLLRAIEARAGGGHLLSLSVEAPGDVALYLLNHKRDSINEIEEEAGLAIAILSSDNMLPGDFKIDAKKDPKSKRKRKPKPIIEGDPDDAEFAAAIAAQDEEDGEEKLDNTEEAPRGRRRGRRGGRKRRPDFEDSETAKAAAEATAAALALPPIKAKAATGKNAPPEDGGAYLDGLSMQMSEVLDDDLTDVAPLRNRPSNSEDADVDGDGDDDKPKRKKRSRRGRRGGRRRSRDKDENVASEENQDASAEVSDVETGADTASEEVQAEPKDSETPDPEKKKPRRRSRSRRRKKPETETGSEDSPSASEKSTDDGKADTQPVIVAVKPTPEPDSAEPVAATEAPVEDKPKKRGWWSRRKG